LKKGWKEVKGYGWLHVALNGVLGVLHDEVRDRATTDWKYMVLALVPKIGIRVPDVRYECLLWAFDLILLGLHDPLLCLLDLLPYPSYLDLLRP
jgi:hypothetical protein